MLKQATEHFDHQDNSAFNLFDLHLKRGVDSAHDFKLSTELLRRSPGVDQELSKLW